MPCINGIRWRSGLTACRMLDFSTAVGVEAGRHVSYQDHPTYSTVKPPIDGFVVACLGVAQPGRVSGLEPECRPFKSVRPERMKMSEIIYVVKASSGDFDSYKEWRVCAYRTEALARAHVNRATQELQRIIDSGVGKRDAQAAVWDEAMTCYRGLEPDYEIEILTLRDALPG